MQIKSYSPPVGDNSGISKYILFNQLYIIITTVSQFNNSYMRLYIFKIAKISIRKFPLMQHIL